MQGWEIVPDINKKLKRRWVGVSTPKGYGYIALWLVSFEKPCNDDGEVISKNGDSVRVRDIPEGDAIKKLKVGTKVRVLASVPCWTKIKFGETVGWIGSEFIKRSEGISNEES